MTTLLYFAAIREKVGHGQEEMKLPDHLATARDLVGWLRSRHEGYEYAFADLSAVRVAIDQAFAGFDDPIRSATEIAFFPPVTGG
ncbi:MAG: molybdopterin converting factor subunit 1 [Parvibaculaceae bacterium]|nr:molybdopterin converting factor subunit 1 [Parvibaculaceae bacterium]